MKKHIQSDITEDEILNYQLGANAGNVEAQYQLALCYYHGNGVKQDYVKAVKWFREAGKQGNAKAQFNLGICYEKGQGIEKDTVEAVNWYWMAAEQGNALAQLNLAVSYENGEGVEKDMVEAVKWYQKAAEQGDVNSQFKLGVCCELGNGVKKDLLAAFNWYSKAATQENPSALFALGTFYEVGEIVPKSYSEAAKWYRQAAEKGLDIAQFKLGMYYKEGDGVQKDKDEAIRWFQRAADQNLKMAQRQLQELQTQSKEQKISKLQSTLNQFTLAHSNEKKIWKFSNFDFARKFGKKADQKTEKVAEKSQDKRMSSDKTQSKTVFETMVQANKGDMESQFELARLYYDGNGIEQDHAKAVEWFQKAAEQGHISAQYNLAVCCEMGDGVAKNIDEAMKWYKKAAQQGHIPAQERLKFSTISPVENVAQTKISSQKESIFYHSLPNERIEKTPEIIGNKYALIDEVNRKQAEILRLQTGYEVEFKPEKNKAKVKLDKRQRKGHFGKVRIAYNIHSDEYVCAKTITGESKIQASKKEAQLQLEVSGKPNIMRLLDSAEVRDSEDQRILYQFMPFASFGNGLYLSEQLASLKDVIPKEKILVHVAKALLTALSGMHEKNIYHLDIKPTNFVLYHNGKVEVVDFGCAQKCALGKKTLITGNGDSAYYSPERLACLRGKTGIIGDAAETALSYEGDRADLWAVAVTLLELVLDRYPFDNTNIEKRIASWNKAYFEKQLQNMIELQEPTFGLMNLIRSLLILDPQKCLTVAQALSHPVFRDKKYSFNSVQEQEEVFIQLKQLKKTEKDIDIFANKAYQDEPKEQNKNYAHTLLFSQPHQYFTPFPVKELQISPVYQTPVVQKTFFKPTQAMEEQREKQEHRSEDKEKTVYQHYPK